MADLTEKTFYYDYRLTGEVKAISEQHAEMLIRNGISLNVRLIEEEFETTLMVTELVEGLRITPVDVDDAHE